MKLTTCIGAIAFGALFAVPAAASGGEAGAPRVEVSDDGRIVVTPVEPTASGSVSLGLGVPYGLVPDWQNDLRRQVGGVQVADMNGDGLADVVAGCYQSMSFPPYEAWPTYIYYNVGGELETSPSWISTDEVSTGDVQVALINGDAYPDIFAANGGFAMSPSVIYFGGPGGPSTSPGWFAADSTWNNYALPIDIDHDGDVDIVTANQGNSPDDAYRPMYLFRNNGGVLPTVPAWQSAETSIQGFLAAGDLDGDGWEDIAVSKWANFESAVYRNVSGNIQTTPTWTTGSTTSDKGVGWADVDGNGDPDLALGHSPTLLYTNEDGVLTQTWSATGAYFGQQDLRFADVDGDGDEDLAEIHFANGYVDIYLNENGVLSSAPAWTYDSPGSGTAIAFGDITGDGRLDLVVGNSGDTSLMVFYAVPSACPADLDGSEDVGFGDVLQLLGAWGPCPGCPQDLDGNGTVAFADLLILLGAWGECP